MVYRRGRFAVVVRVVVCLSSELFCRWLKGQLDANQTRSAQSQDYKVQPSPELPAPASSSETPVSQQSASGAVAVLRALRITPTLYFCSEPSDKTQIRMVQQVRLEHFMRSTDAPDGLLFFFGKPPTDRLRCFGTIRN